MAGTNSNTKCTGASSADHERETNLVETGSYLTRKWLTAAVALVRVLFCSWIVTSETVPDQDLTSLSIEDVAKVKVSARSGVDPESRSMPCDIPAESRSADSRRSCQHQSDRSSFLRRRWRVASADAPPLLPSRAAADDRRSAS